MEQQYRKSLYHAVNDALEGSLLSPEDQQAFRENNRTVNRLLIAKDAAGEKLVREGLKSASPLKTVISSLNPAKAVENLANAVPEGADYKTAITASQKTAAALANAASAVRLGRMIAPSIARFTAVADLVPQQSGNQ